MKTFAWALVAAGLAASNAWAEVDKEQVKKLLAAGVPQDSVVAFIEKNRPVARLSADDLVELKAAGAGDRVLAALLADPPGRPDDSDLPRTVRIAGDPGSTVFGDAYLYDPRLKACIPLRAARPAAPICDWGPTFTTVPFVIRCLPPPAEFRPCVTVTRRTCRPAIVIPARRCR